ncbi:MAG: hypothetical protein OXU23_08505 [Candidatus Poribacteria bacterium]|nr:hypothetical protein [Candidatus Poribacteria bacterium]
MLLTVYAQFLCQCQYAKYIDKLSISRFELPEKEQAGEVPARFCAGEVEREGLWTLGAVP